MFLSKRTIGIALLFTASAYAGLLDGAVGGLVNGATGVASNVADITLTAALNLFSNLARSSLDDVLAGNAAKAIVWYDKDATYTANIDGKETVYSGAPNVLKFYEGEVARGAKRVTFSIDAVKLLDRGRFSVAGTVNAVFDKGVESGTYTGILRYIAGTWVLTDVTDTRKSEL